MHEDDGLAVNKSLERTDKEPDDEAANKSLRTKRRSGWYADFTE